MSWVNKRKWCINSLLRLHEWTLCVCEILFDVTEMYDRKLHCRALHRCRLVDFYIHSQNISILYGFDFMPGVSVFGEFFSSFELFSPENTQ